MNRHHFIIDKESPREPYVGCYVRVSTEGIWRVDAIHVDKLQCGGMQFWSSNIERVMTKREVNAMFKLTEGFKVGDNVYGKDKDGFLISGNIAHIYPETFRNKIWIKASDGYTHPLRDGSVKKLP